MVRLWYFVTRCNRKRWGLMLTFRLSVQGSEFQVPNHDTSACFEAPWTHRRLRQLLALQHQRNMKGRRRPWASGRRENREFPFPPCWQCHHLGIGEASWHTGTSRRKEAGKWSSECWHWQLEMTVKWFGVGGSEIVYGIVITRECWIVGVSHLRILEMLFEYMDCSFCGRVSSRMRRTQCCFSKLIHNQFWDYNGFLFAETRDLVTVKQWTLERLVQCFAGKRHFSF